MAEPWLTPGARNPATDSSPDSRSPDGRVTVTRTDGPRPVRSLVVDGVVQGDDSPLGLVMASRLGLLPALLCPSARDALVIGLGTGVTVGALAAALDGATVTAVERHPGVIQAVGAFRAHWARPIDRPPVALVAAEGRAYLEADKNRHDLILCDLIIPAGGEALYARGFYQLCADRLTPAGGCAHALPLFQVPGSMLQRVAAAFLDVFPAATLWLGSFNTYKPVALLVGSRTGALRFSGDSVGRVSIPGGFECGMLSPEDRAAVPAAGLATAEDVRALLLLDTGGLRRFAGAAQPYEGAEPLVTGREATDGLADGGLANLQRLLASAERVDPTGRAFFEACRADDGGDLTAALAGYRRVMAAWPDDPLVRMKAADASSSVHLARGLACWATGDLAAAEAAVRRAISTAPARADAHEVLAKLLTALGRHVEALAAIETALAIDPADKGFRAGRAAIRHNLGRG